MDIVTKTPGMGVDFHMHTLASDGLWTPQSLVETAVAQGVKIMTVSDHDTIANVPAVKAEAEKRGIGFIPGVEITVSWKGKNHHLLMFNFDPTDPDLTTLLKDTQNRLDAKKQGIIEGLKNQGYKLSKLDELRKPDDTFLSIDIARALLRGGEVPNFDRAVYLCRQFGLDETINQPADKAMAIGLRAGGVPVIAHPARNEYDIAEANLNILNEFVEMGLGGIEIYHYSHKLEDIERLTAFARQNDLAISCGSDSHNEARKPMPWNPELCRSLLERLNRQAPSLAA
jgi:3',5'-nucleoside bisphosphate phosphatase